MSLLIISLSALFFFLHLVFETLASFIKYNYAALGRHMTGLSISNIFAIVSRGCVALFGVCIAIIIEKNLLNINVYGLVFGVVLTFAAVFSLVLSGKRIEYNNFIINEDKFWLRFLKFKSVLSPNTHRMKRPINKLISLLLGIQFVAIIIAYGMCFVLIDYRLLIISMVPVASMIGTFVTFIIVEPRLAGIIDLDRSQAYSVSREFLRARAVSFFSCAIVLLSTVIIATHVKIT